MNHKFADGKDLKTYSRTAKKTHEADGQKSKEDDSEVPLTTLNAVKYLLQGTLRLRVCRYCLNVTSKLSEFDEVLTLAVSGALHEVTVRDIVASFHPYKVAEDPNFPNKICNKCVERAIGCYLFTQQCDRAERALRNCFDDIYEKFEKLDSIEPVKRRGKRKLHPNHNIIHAEHENVIDYAEPVINIVNVTNDYTVEQSNNKISELECPKCWQILPNVEALMNHEDSHPKSMWFNCRLCGKSFVKRSHLRKHIKATHAYVQETEDVKIDDFKCNECGFTNKTLGEHLQHNEKHKFKSLVKSLVERKVDSLCTVCLDKSSRLMSLNDIVHLHGGYTGLTGDKSIENILTATIPGTNQHKYEELMVPHHAKILQLKKRKRKLDHEVKDSFSQDTKRKFVFSAPDSVQKTDFESTSSIAFTFSKPVFNYPVNILKECTIDENGFDYCNSGNDSSKELMSVERSIFVFAAPVVTQRTDFELTSSIMFTFPKPVFNDPVKILKESKILDKDGFDDFNSGNNSSKELMCVEEINNNTIYPESKQEKTCKCWIFKTPNCEKCVKNKIAVLKDEQSNEDKIVKDNCNYCWVFGKTGKCDHCNKYVDCNNKISTDTEVKVIIKEDCNYCWIFGKTEKCDYCNKNVDCNNKIICNDNKEIKIHNLNEVSEKQIERVSKNVKKLETLWQCNVCLTTNPKNISTCFCCEEERGLKENAKSSFGNLNLFSFNKTYPITSGSNDNGHVEINVTDQTTNQVDVVIANEKLKFFATEKEITTIPDVKEVHYDASLTINKERKEEREKREKKKKKFLPGAKKSINDNSQVINKQNIGKHTDIGNRMCLQDNKEVREDSKMDVDIIPFRENNLKHCMNNNYIIDRKNIATDSNIEDMDVAFDDNNLPTNATTVFSNTPKPANENTSMETKQNICQTFTFNLGASGPKDNKNRRIKKASRRTYK